MTLFYKFLLPQHLVAKHSSITGKRRVSKVYSLSLKILWFLHCVDIYLFVLILYNTFNISQLGFLNFSPKSSSTINSIPSPRKTCPVVLHTFSPLCTAQKNYLTFFGNTEGEGQGECRKRKEDSEQYHTEKSHFPLVRLSLASSFSDLL